MTGQRSASVMRPPGGTRVARAWRDAVPARVTRGGNARKDGDMAVELPPVWVKTYAADTMPEATILLQADTAAAWADGYAVSSQVWADGGRTSAAAACLFLGVTVLAAGVFLWLPLCLAGLFLLVAGALSGKGPGTLSVTFARPRLSPGYSQ